MNEFEAAIVNRGFVISRKALIEGKGLYVDDTNKKWTISGSNMTKVKRFKFSQIIDYEVIQDNKETEYRTSDLRRSSATEEIRRLQVRISLDDIDTPSVIFDVVKGLRFFGYVKGDSKYYALMEQVHKLTSLLDYMKKNSN